jgi:hypothetical protein
MSYVVADYCGGFGGAGGIITINGGTVTVTGNTGAGIGGGFGGAGGAITISDGTVTANGGVGAGIGGGYAGAGGDITISGGTITATGGDGNAGIGGGYAGVGSGYASVGGNYVGVGGNITISGGTVTATGGAGSVGIGDNSGLCGMLACNILIFGENTRVTAKSGGNGVQDIGSRISTTADNVFVALPQGHLILSNPSAANDVLFTADPASGGTVSALFILPTPISLLTGALDTTGKTLSIITTAGAGSVTFEFGISIYDIGQDVAMAGIDLMTPGVKVAFGGPPPSSLPLAPQVVTGAWYDPAHTGSGFNMLMTAESGLSVFYYGWDSNGNRLWLVSEVSPSPTQIVPGTSFTLSMMQTNSGGFLTPADPSTSMAV